MTNQNMTRDGRNPLPAGAVIIGKNGTRYTIQAGEIGYGGSALVYRASKNNSRRLFVVKECYPRSDKYRFIRRDGVICAANADNPDAVKYLSLLKQDMIRENEIGQAVAAKTGRVIAPWEDLDAEQIIFDGRSYDAGESFFITMEQAVRGSNSGWFLHGLLDECDKPADENFPLRTGDLPSPYVVVCIMEELLKALRDVHRAGYVHADIQDSNFFMMGNEPKTGDIGVGMLLDFGNARKLESDGKTAKIADKRIFSTRGYCAPEIMYGNDGTLQLTPATDIFSAGCLMLYLLKGMDFRDRWGADLANLIDFGSPFSAEDALERGYGRDAAFLLEKILSRALEFEPEDRYRDAGEMLAEIVKLKKLSVPPKFQLSPNLSRSAHWVPRSRDVELARLQKYLKEGRQPLYIWGIAGVGKTELAMEFARRQPYKAYLVSFRGTMKETILQMDFANYSFRYEGGSDSREQEYRDRLNILKTDYAGTLLIVDNFDSETTDIARLQQEPAFKEITGLDLHVLFTTRSRPDATTPELGPFSENSAFTLFSKIVYDDSDGGAKIAIPDDEEKSIRELLREIDYHPLTVELAARAVCDSWNTITPQNLLTRFKYNVVYRDNRTAKIYEQIRTLFKLCSFDEEYREVLAHVTLLPVDGIDAALILGSEDGAKKNHLKRIESRGFVRRRKEDNRLKIHPLIRSVIKNEIAPTYADCDEFLTALWKNFDDTYPPNFSLYRQGAEVYENAEKNFRDSRSISSYRAGHCHIVVGNDAVGSVEVERAISLRGDAPEDYALAQMYSDAGLANMRLLSSDAALKCYKKTLEILQNVAPDSPEIANTLASIADFYELRQNYPRAHKFAKIAVGLFELAPPEKKQYLAHAHNALANALNGLDKPREALPHIEKAVEIIKSLSPAAGSPDLATLYSNLASIHALAGNFDAALNFVQMAIDMQARLLPFNHSDTIRSYMILSEIYSRMGRQDTAAAYSRKIAEILQRLNFQRNERMIEIAIKRLEISKMLAGSDSNSVVELSRNYRRVAEIYRGLKDTVSAEKNILLAIETLGDRNLPEDDFLNFVTASDIYCDMKNLPVALDFAFKALAIADSESLDMIYMKLGNLYIDLKNDAEALNYYEKSREAQLKRAAPDYGTVAILDRSLERLRKKLSRE